MSWEPGLIYYNSNSGAQALNLVVLWGARRILLIGFDGGPLHGKDHFFGKHPKPLRDNSPYGTFRRNFTLMAPDLRKRGIEVINTSADSLIDAFPKVKLEEAVRRCRTPS